MKSTSEAVGLSGKHTNHSVCRTMISTLRKENVEPLIIIALAGQRNLKSLDSYSSTSTKQQKDMSLKLSCCVEGEERHKSVAKSQVLTAKQQDQNRGNNLFSGAVFNNCNFTLTTAEAGFGCDNAVPSAKKFKRICPSLIATMNFKQTFIILIFENFIAYISRRYFLDFENASLSFLKENSL